MIIRNSIEGVTKEEKRSGSEVEVNGLIFFFFLGGLEFRRKIMMQKKIKIKIESRKSSLLILLQLIERKLYERLRGGRKEEEKVSFLTCSSS